MTTVNQPNGREAAVRVALSEPHVAKNPGSFFQELRDTCPVARSEDLGGSG
jgi:hypothetical protein